MANCGVKNIMPHMGPRDDIKKHPNEAADKRKDADTDSEKEYLWSGCMLCDI
jgi:hypothetical protein